MNNAISNFLVAFIGFSAIGVGSWLFSSRPRLIVKTFVPKEDYRYAVRTILGNPEFTKEMRVIACLQIGTGCVFGIFDLWR